MLFEGVFSAISTRIADAAPPRWLIDWLVEPLAASQAVMWFMLFLICGVTIIAETVDVFRIEAGGFIGILIDAPQDRVKGE